MFLQNVSSHKIYTAPHPRKLNSSEFSSLDINIIFYIFSLWSLSFWRCFPPEFYMFLLFLQLKPYIQQSPLDLTAVIMLQQRDV
jgi:hypothetical protein